MIKSLILTTAVRYLLPLMLLFSVFVLLRGHNDPGGGFVGGLVAASAFALYAIGFGVAEARRLLPVTPLSLLRSGLLIALLSGIFSIVVKGAPFMTGVWDDTTLPAIGKLGTPLIFDVGVYLTVIGVTLMIIFSLSEDS